MENENETMDAMPENQVKGEERTWHMVLAYNGTAYSGWQVQSDCRTVQGELRMRLRLMLQEPELKQKTAKTKK